MTVPTRSITINDGGNGVSLGVGPVRALIGVSSSGTYDTIYSMTAPKAADDLGIGPLVDACKYELENGGGTVLAIRAVDSVAGVITTGAPSQDGDGTCVASGTPNNRYQIAVEIVTAGELGGATFKYSLDAGPDDSDEEQRNWSLPITVPAGGAYVLPNTGVTITFANNTPVSFQVGDTFWFSTTAPAFQTADLNNALDALIAYSGYWRYVHVIGEVDATIFAAVDTKMTLAETNHKYRFALLEATDVDPIGAITSAGTAPPVNTGNVTGIPQGSWDVVLDIVLGGALTTMTYRVSTDGGNTYGSTVTSTVGAETLGDTGLTITWQAGSYNADNTYSFSTWDENEATWQAALISSYSAVNSSRVMVGAGFGELVLPSGQVVRRPIAWGISAMLAKLSISTDLGSIEDSGTLPGFVSITHDEAASPGLDDARFATSRTWEGFSGLYVNQARMAAVAGSDYDLAQYRQVMDEACRVLDIQLALTLNKKIRIDSDTGFIDELYARGLDQRYETAISDAVLPEHATSVNVRIRRDENLLSTRAGTVDFDLVGVGYFKTLTANAGYKNPVLGS